MTITDKSIRAEDPFAYETISHHNFLPGPIHWCHPTKNIDVHGNSRFRTTFSVIVDTL